MSKDRGRSVSEVVGILGAVASLAAVGIWMLERGDANESRSLRQAELIELASKAIRDEAADGIFTNSPDVSWAFHVFAKYGVTANIEADEIDLLSADLRCVRIDARSNSFSIDNSYLQDTLIFYESQAPIEIKNSLILGGHIVHHFNSDESEFISKGNFISLLGYSNWISSSLIPRVSLEDTVAVGLNVASAKQSIDLEAYKFEAPTEVSRKLCTTATSRTDGDGFEYVKCQTEKSAPDLIEVEMGPWLDNWPFSNLFGSVDTTLCQNREKIKLSRTPFQGVVE